MGVAYIMYMCIKKLEGGGFYVTPITPYRPVVPWYIDDELGLSSGVTYSALC
jgi:hypothetical protein